MNPLEQALHKKSTKDKGDKDEKKDKHIHMKGKNGTCKYCGKKMEQDEYVKDYDDNKK